MANDIPVVNWTSDFPDGELPQKAIGSKILVIALDTEYQTNYTATTNLCLSYQYAAYDLFEGRYKTSLFYPDINKQERYTLGEFIRRVLDDLNMPISTLHHYRIILIAHYFTAEWAMFADRNDLYMKFEYIRKTMVTSSRPLKTTILDENGHKVNLWLDVRDTMLLLPEGYKNLESASSFIEGFEKIKVADEYKSNMYQLLQDDPELFKQYAVRDAEVTLKLFIKLQYQLNIINRTKTKLFSTLASATTNHYKKFSENKFGEKTHKAQYEKWNRLYREYESLANRGYLGGLNSSYHIGNCEGYTFIDIDFKNAYPTAMNLLRIGMFGDKLERPDYEKKASAITLEGLGND